MRALALLLAAPLLFGQDGKYETHLGTETLELLGGIAVRHGDGRADQAMGTRLSGGLNRWLSLYGEFGYSRIISEETHIRVKQELRGSLMDFGGGVELHLSGSRIQHYILGGIGSARISAKASIGSATATASEYHFASPIGGGVRIFASRNIGFSAEARTVWINGGGGLPSGGRFERYALGVFYQGRAR